jgi:hypothetical protein
MADGGSGEIIIRGGSVKITFDGSLYVKETEEDPNNHKHPTRKITRVQVDDEAGKPRFDSGTDDGGGLQWTITVSTSET